MKAIERFAVALADQAIPARKAGPNITSLVAAAKRF